MCDIRLKSLIFKKKSKGDHLSEKALGRVAASEGVRSTPPRAVTRYGMCVMNRANAQPQLHNSDLHTESHMYSV